MIFAKARTIFHKYVLTLTQHPVVSEFSLTHM